MNADVGDEKTKSTKALKVTVPGVLFCSFSFFGFHRGGSERRGRCSSFTPLPNPYLPKDAAPFGSQTLLPPTRVTVSGNAERGNAVGDRWHGDLSLLSSRY